MISYVNRHLQYKLLLAFALVLTLPVVLLTVYVVANTSSAFTEVARLNMLQVATNRAREVETAIISARAELLFLSQDSAIRSYINRFSVAEAAPEVLRSSLEQVDNLLQSFVARGEGLYKRACLVDAAGDELSCARYAMGQAVSVMPTELSNRLDSDFFTGALRQRSIPSAQAPVYISNEELQSHIGDADSQNFYVLRYSTLLQSDDDIIAGVIVIEVAVEPLVELVRRDAPRDVYVISNDGAYLVAPDGFSVLSTDVYADRGDDAAAIMTSESGTLYATPSHPDLLQAYARIRPKGQTLQWTVLYEQPTAVITRPVTQAAQFALVLIAGGLGLTVLFAYPLTRQIVGPIQRLAGAASAVTPDHWDVPLPEIRSPDEIGTLSDAFAHMKSKLSDVIMHLEARVNELERMQQALQLSEVRFTKVFEAAPVAIMISRLKDGFFLDANDSALMALGYGRDELIGKTSSELMIWPEPGMREEIISQVRVVGRVAGVEMPVRAKSGELREVLLAMERISYDGEELLLSLFSDITLRKQTEARMYRHMREVEALRRIAEALSSTLHLEQVLHTLLENLADLVPYDAASCVLLADDSFRYVATAGLVGEFNVSAASTIVDHYITVETCKTLFTPRIFTERAAAFDRADVSFACHLIAPILYRGQVQGLLNLHHITPDFYTESDAELVEAVARQAATAIENAQLYSRLEQRVNERTAELRQEKERTEIILTHATDAIVLTDPAGHILYVNPAWERLNGYSAVEVVGSFPSVLKSNKTPNETYGVMWQTISAGKTWAGEVKNRRKDGTLYDCELVIAPVLEAGQSITYFVGVLRDITEMRRLEAMKARFISDAAHDLGNPVAVLNTSLYFLKKAPEQLEQRLPIVEYQVERLNALIQDLLTIARIDRRDGVFQYGKLALNPLTAQVVEAQLALAVKGDIDLRFDPASDLPYINGDVQDIERVIVNLVSNALHYTLEGGSTTVRTYFDDDWVVLEVKDTGIGIAPEDLPHIFDRFFRSPQARDTSPGTGLGLSIVREIVTRHGGEVHVESKLGDGSCFYVQLPRWRDT